MCYEEFSGATSFLRCRRNEHHLHGQQRMMAQHLKASFLLKRLKCVADKNGKEMRERGWEYWGGDYGYIIGGPFTYIGWRDIWCSVMCISNRCNRV